MVKYHHPRRNYLLHSQWKMFFKRICFDFSQKKIYLIYKKGKSLSRVQHFETPWTIQSMNFSRPEYWSGQHFPSTGDIPKLGIKPNSPALQVDSLPAEPQGKCMYKIRTILVTDLAQKYPAKDRARNWHSISSAEAKILQCPLHTNQSGLGSSVFWVLSTVLLLSLRPWTN